MAQLTAETFIQGATPEEKKRWERIEAVLPQVRDAAKQTDEEGAFHMPHVKAFSDAGLLGLIIPEEYGGLGGGLRDLCAATYSLGRHCPSTALCFFFHCSGASRGLLPLAALEAGLFTDEEGPQVRHFAEQVLYGMGRDAMWFANFASESVKSERAAVTINTTATKVEGGYSLTGVKSYGTNTGVADVYLVTASLEGYDTADGLCTFYVKRESEGVETRAPWAALGLRGSNSNGITMENVFVPDDCALAMPGSFVKSVQMSKSSFVGNQMAASAIYLGAAQSIYDYAIKQLTEKKFADTGRPIGTANFQQQFVGEMMVSMETANLWLRRQLELEAAEEPILPKEKVVQRWRLCKGVVAENAFDIAVNALKACGTSGTQGAPGHAIRELAVSLVHGFPPERGRFMAAAIEIEGEEQAAFGASGK